MEGVVYCNTCGRIIEKGNNRRLINKRIKEMTDEELMLWCKQQDQGLIDWDKKKRSETFEERFKETFGDNPTRLQKITVKEVMQKEQILREEAVKAKEESYLINYHILNTGIIPIDKQEREKYFENLTN